MPDKIDLLTINSTTERLLNQSKIERQQCDRISVLINWFMFILVVTTFMTGATIQAVIMLNSSCNPAVENCFEDRGSGR